MRGLLLAGLFLVSPGGGSAQERGVSIVDVPFIAQTEDLCGGAAAAMVLRYWGHPDVQAEDFASLVDRSRGGINTGDLTRAILARGFSAFAITARPEDIMHEIDRGRPVMALIDAGRGRFHFVVVVAWAVGQVVFHDPAVGPFRVRSAAEFTKDWEVAGRWALVATPATAPPTTPPTASPSPVSTERPRLHPPAASPCDSLLDGAVPLGRGENPEAATPSLLAAIALCPKDSRPRVALAGVRFRQERWKDAAQLAREGVGLDETDLDTWRLLATSLYLAEQNREALSAWNRAGEPRIDRIQIDGLERTRQDIATAVLGLKPRDVLTPNSLSLAERRLQELPTSQGARVIYRPTPGGRADIVASVQEGRLFERLSVLLLRVGVEAGAKRETTLGVNSPTGRGERLEFGGRVASRRPAAWVSLETPRLGGLPGLVKFKGLWDRQTYRLGGAVSASAVVETRRRGSAEWSHWLTAKSRFEIEAGVDRFDGLGTFASLRGGVDRRLVGDHVAVLGDAGWWAPVGEAPGFGELGATTVFRSHTSPDRWTLHARFAARRATREAPFALWPGAGKGPGRPLLLRGSRLHRDGVVTGDAFGRGLLQGTLEVEKSVYNRGLLRLGVAAFTDWAKAFDTSRFGGSSPNIFALGLGMRLRLLHSTALRIDVAKRPGRGGLVFSAGVIPEWPH